MRCEQIMEWLPWYLQGSLSPLETREVTRHLGSCPACARWLEEVREMEALWKEMEPDFGMHSAQSEEIPDLVGPVMAEIERLEARRRDAEAKPQVTGRRFQVRTSWLHYGLAACLTFVLVQFGVFEHLGYGLSEMNGHMSTSVTEFFSTSGNQPHGK